MWVPGRALLPLLLIGFTAASRVCGGPLSVCWRFGTCFYSNSSPAGISHDYCCSDEGLVDSTNCWGHPGYPPEACCPGRFELPQSTCPPELLDRIAWLLDRDASDAPPLWQVATDEAAVDIFLKKHTTWRCAIAFIAHRIFLYTKIPRWAKHFGILVDPDAVSHDVFSLSSMVVAFDFLRQLPLTILIGDSVFSRLWIERALGHWRKLKCYVWQDTWQLHPRTGSCDADEDSLEQKFKRRITFFLNRGALPPGLDDSRSMLSTAEPAGCELSKICAALILFLHGAITSEEVDYWWSQLRSPGFTLTTSWPLLPLLSMGSEAVLSTPRATADQHDKTPLVVVECNEFPVVTPSLHYNLSYISRPDCIPLLPQIIPDVGHVALLSPKHWHYENEASLPLMVASMIRSNLLVAGFPVVDPNGRWSWPCLKFHREDVFHQLVTVTPYATGYESYTADHSCVKCGTTSQSRVYEAQALRSILRICGGSVTLTEFALCQDLIAFAGGDFGIYTCHHFHPVRESPYFSRLDHLPEWLSATVGATVLFLEASLPPRAITACAGEHRGSFGPCETHEFRAWISSWLADRDIVVQCASAFLPVPLHRYGIEPCPQVMNKSLWLNVNVCATETYSVDRDRRWPGVEFIGSSCSYAGLYRLPLAHTRLLFGDGVRVWVNPSVGYFESSSGANLPGVSLEVAEWSATLPDLLAVTKEAQAAGTRFIALLPNATSPATKDMLVRLTGAECAVAGGLTRYENSLLWPARRVRYAWWKVEVLDTRPDRRACQRADSTSTTRVYRTEALLRILGQILDSEDTLLGERAELFSPVATASKVLLLDAVASRMGVNVCTCKQILFDEPDWAQQLKGVPFPGVHSVFIEGIRVDDLRKTCTVQPVDSDAVLTENYKYMEHYRSVTPLCNRLWLEDSFIRLVEWWTSGAPEGSRVALARQGTLLSALFRSGDIGMIPWDYDLEVTLVGLDRDYMGDPTETGLCSTVVAAGVFAGVPLKTCELVEDLTFGMESDPATALRERVAVQLGPFTIAVIYTEMLPSDLVAVPMFGASTKIHFSLRQWDWWYHNIYRGSSSKLIGGGNVADHNPWELFVGTGAFVISQTYCRLPEPAVACGGRGRVEDGGRKLLLMFLSPHL
ncbi:hypothetical protein FOZ63_024000 [Perkinsus olseni]|uniref:Uncharacterized protein n=1 Tax=Perkinsus olseni TaxID=32597 RepID=A0A7J6QSN8_PEROL|nr:hypothetical protein FOZ63_024000 [Perkinsus olseni]